MRPLTRYGGALFAAALAVVPAQAAHRKPVGVVSQTDRGYIDSANAVSGADVYDCDNLTTDDNGQMRLQVPLGQVFLMAGSEAQLQQGLSELDVYVTHGTVGFASNAGAAIDLITPAGFLRSANGQAASGEVTITSPKGILITAISGDLTLDDGGEFRHIAPGQTAKVAFDVTSAPSCHVDQAFNHPNPVAHRWIGFYFIAPASIGLPAYFIWRRETESDSQPPQN
ncbi:MAG TPA: hypothetical protein VMB02_02845 [Candidatus Aquilonibacter sp.]|nr:hypothetical protein [Candidatus Aquilonibacter sp.]